MPRYSMLTYRRCELSWVNGVQIGAKFMKRVGKKNSSAGGNTSGLEGLGNYTWEPKGIAGVRVEEKN